MDKDPYRIFVHLYNFIIAPYNSIPGIFLKNGACDVPPKTESIV